MANLLIAADPIKKSPKEKQLLVPASEDVEIDPRDALSETVQDFGFGVAQGVTFNLADEAYGAAKSLIEDIPYAEARDEARRSWMKARERSPVASLGGEIVGSVASPASKILGAGKGLKGIARGAAEGAAQSYGATDRESALGQTGDVILGSAIGGATGAASNLFTKTFSKSPTDIRSEVLGVKPKDYLVKGPGDRKKIVERINETGMLKNRKMEYNPQTMKFEPRSKSKFTLDELEKNTEERLLARADDAASKLQTRKINEFGTILDTKQVSIADLNNMADEIALEYSKRGLSKGPMDRANAALRISENIKDQINFNGSGLSPNGAFLKDLDLVKRMAQEDVKNFSKSLAELGDTEELARITSRKLKELVEKGVGDPNFTKINSAQHDFLTVGGDLLERVKSLKLEPARSKSYGHTSILDRFIEGATGSSQGRLEAAGAKEIYEGLPKFLNPAKAVVPYALEEAPGAVLRQKFQGGTTKENWRNPGSLGFGNTMLTPREVINYKLPRSTEGLLQNKEMVLAKLVQNGIPEDMLDAVAQALNEDHDSVSKIAPLLVTQLPTLFERSKYKVFDGQFLDPQDRAKAADDISKRDDLNSIERARMINQINKSNKVPEGIA